MSKARSPRDVCSTTIGTRTELCICDPFQTSIIANRGKRRTKTMRHTMQSEIQMRLEGAYMDKFLDGKKAVVTGGTKGIGWAITEALLEAGADVAICGRSEESVRKSVSKLTPTSKSKVMGKAADVRDNTQVSEFFKFVD